MSNSTVAACMAPLLLRPLLAGECEIETDFNVGGDSSTRVLQAAAAANHAQITLQLFELSGSGTEEATNDDESYEDDDQDGATPESDAYTNDDLDNASSRSCSEFGGERERERERERKERTEM
ncbi:hypothetical protein KPL71_021815 [Citrus sinensis]|uniref:Uncharacterized protein n=1 Tax=Citrus sinensis TaxID=2711 RepID=A0ACB8JJ13_CITSI|nr:hypothetical protein KPL71_021815 [Citrus sinensis]